jgi:hypothetical protein
MRAAVFHPVPVHAREQPRSNQAEIQRMLIGRAVTGLDVR